MATAQGTPNAQQSYKSSIDMAEINHFEKLSDDWWHEGGIFAALHTITPARVLYIRQQACRLLSQPIDAPLNGLKVLDIGCGGGILAEPLARLGAHVVGIDASHKAIQSAIKHSEQAELNITYHAITAEEFADQTEGEYFDIVIASEVIEHVAHRPDFLKTMALFAHKNHKQKKTMVVLTTINRTLISAALAKYAAEYILELAPRGTHEIKKFVRPQELVTEAQEAHIILDDITGIRPSLRHGFSLGGMPLINYAASGLVQQTNSF